MSNVTEGKSSMICAKNYKKLSALELRRGKKGVGEPGKGQIVTCMLAFGNLFLYNEVSLRNVQ